MPKNSPARTAQNANFASHTQQLTAQHHTLQQAQELAQRDKNHTQSLANKRVGWHGKISQAEQRQQTAEQEIAILQAEALPTRWGAASALVPLVASLLFFQILNLFSIQVLRKAHPTASRTAATSRQNATECHTPFATSAVQRWAKDLNRVGKRLQESRALAEGLVANLGEDGEGKPAALKHGGAARAALWRQVLLLAKIPQPMAGRMKAAKSAEPYHDPAKAKVVAGNITFPSFMGSRGLVPLRGVGQRLTNPW